MNKQHLAVLRKRPEAIVDDELERIRSLAHLRHRRNDLIAADQSMLWDWLRDRWNVRFIAPVHCTGEPGFAILKESFGDRYLYAGLGTTLLLGPKVTVKAELGQPNKQAMDEDDVRGYREAWTKGPLRAFLGTDKRLVQLRQ